MQPTLVTLRSRSGGHRKLVECFDSFEHVYILNPSIKQASDFHLNASFRNAYYIRVNKKKCVNYIICSN